MGMPKFVSKIKAVYLSRFAAVALAMVTAAAIGSAAVAQPSAPGTSDNSPAVSQPATPAPAVEAPAAPISGASVIANAALPRDLSPWGMFLNADIVVKIVMIGLVFASLVTWTVWLAKSVELWRAKRTAGQALIVLNEVRSLAEANARLGERSDPVPRLVSTALHEAQTSS